MRASMARMTRLGLPFALAGILVVAGPVDGRAQDAQPQPPTSPSQSTVDLVPMDVAIVDSTGRPVSGLEARDFTLTVDGKPRRVASAEFVSSAGDLTPPTPSNSGSNAAAGAGRLIMIVVDQGNISAGRGKQALDAAAMFVEQLGPADRVGLVAIPGAGPQ